MPSIYRPTSYPDVLVVHGDDVFDSEYRRRLYDYLHGREARDSPVRPGTHSFWVTYATPSQGGGEYSGLGDATDPHPLHGVIRMDTPGDVGDTDAMRRHLRVLLQEVGHYWLVPAELGFDIEGRRTAPLRPEQLLAAINNDSVGNQLPITGRDYSHWAAQLAADGSPFDGQDWLDLGTDHGRDHWKWVEQSGPRVQPDGLAELELLGSFSDLDLTIMGAIEARNAYPGRGGQVRWMVPQLTAPLEYQTGVMVAFSRTDIVYFGFSEDHRRLAVSRTSNALAGRELAKSRIHEGLVPPFGVQLRVVRRGNDYYFQARSDRTVGLHLSPEPRDLGALALAARATQVPGLFDGIDAPAATATPDTLDGTWRTIARVTESAAPQAVGLITRKWRSSVLCESAFFNLETQVGRDHTVHRFDRRTPLGSLAGAPFSDAPADRPVLDLPNAGASVRYAGDHVLVLAAPFGGFDALGNVVYYNDDDTPANGFGHSRTIDHAPKVVLRAPRGDFAFGTAAAMRRTLQPPQAGGSARDTEMWGRAHAVSIRDLALGAGAKVKQVVDGSASLPCAFIVVAKTTAEADALVPRVDEVRRYWSRTFAAATRGAVRMSTRLAR